MDPRPLSVSDVSLQGASLTQPGPTSQSGDLHTSPWPCPWGSCARTSLRTQRHRTACTSPAQRQSRHTSCLQHPKYHLLLLNSPRQRGACRRHTPCVAQVQSTDAPTPRTCLHPLCHQHPAHGTKSVFGESKERVQEESVPLDSSYGASISMHLLSHEKGPPHVFHSPFPRSQKITDRRKASTKPLC